MSVRARLHSALGAVSGVNNAPERTVLLVLGAFLLIVALDRSGAWPPPNAQAVTQSRTEQFRQSFPQFSDRGVYTVTVTTHKPWLGLHHTTTFRVSVRDQGARAGTVVCSLWWNRRRATHFPVLRMSRPLPVSVSR